jgi:hypothetical protein
MPYRKGRRRLFFVVSRQLVHSPGRNVTMAELASVMQRAALDYPVLDKTGLTAPYSMALSEGASMILQARPLGCDFAAARPQIGSDKGIGRSVGRRPRRAPLAELSTRRRPLVGLIRVAHIAGVRATGRRIPDTTLMTYHQRAAFWASNEPRFPNIGGEARRASTERKWPTSP